ncbi:MAG: 2-oxoacid:acceptor oxidoreductase subunit alpha [Elusimicrobia bacterium]|nr:2-oxoacid:acceptor oxidoreductase subunit alpha [Candidatus Liberimonas magnetica]
MMDKKQGYSIVLAGEAGQGIQSIESILVRAFKLSGYNVFASQEYMSRVRGGINSTAIRVSSNKVYAYSDRIDVLLCLTKGSVIRLSGRIGAGTIVIGEEENIETEMLSKNTIIRLPLTKIAEEIGGKIFLNVITAGIIASLFDCEKAVLTGEITKLFKRKGEDILTKNIKAVDKGYSLGDELKKKENIDFKINKDNDVKHEILVDGAEILSLGFISGGCNFISAYPMSPSTGILTYMAKNAEKFGIAVEQAEDEISAINMAIGAFYTGAKALASTSGGGFALMEEGVSLAAMTETPLVIHLAQRPGPATGLPTRTEQADLELALYSGHGEFPRIIFAPGTLKDMFMIGQKAFYLADKYQVTVFVLTDQYIIDAYYNMKSLELDENKENFFVKTSKDYKRYKLAGDGISPRGIPGYGEGMVCADSDEHDEDGRITEDLSLRVKMVDKRLKKMELIKQDILEPELIGNKDYKTLVIGWGSTCHIIDEAISNIGTKDASFLYFKQVYPLHPKTSEYLKKAKKLIIVENNATSQFAKLIKLETGIEIENKILKYSGMPFSVEEVEQKLKEIIVK